MIFSIVHMPVALTTGQMGSGLTSFALAGFGLGVALAFGLAIVVPGGPALRILKVVGGLLLLWLAVDGFRSAAQDEEKTEPRATLPPAARGSAAVS